MMETDVACSVSAPMDGGATSARSFSWKAAALTLLVRLMNDPDGSAGAEGYPTPVLSRAMVVSKYVTRAASAG